MEYLSLNSYYAVHGKYTRDSIRREPPDGWRLEDFVSSLQKWEAVADPVFLSVFQKRRSVNGAFLSYHFPDGDSIDSRILAKNRIYQQQ